MDSANTTGNTMEVTNTCTVSQSSPNSGYTTTIASQPSPNNTPLIATTTLTTTIASQPSRDNTPLISTTTLTTTITSQPSPNNTPLTATTALETSAFPSKPNAFTSTVLTSSPPPVLQSSYSFVSTDPIPDPTTAPSLLLTGILSVVGILCIAAVIMVVVLIVVIRGRKKAAMTVENGRYATLCSYSNDVYLSCKVR